MWQGLKQIGLEPSVVLRQARLPVTLCMRELGDRRQVSTEEFFRLREAVRALDPDPAAAICEGDKVRARPSRREKSS